MKLHQLRALVAIAETGRIQEASNVLHMTQPALSKAIKELEMQLGTTLFERSNKGIRMTPTGERLAMHARLISENVRRARDDMAALQGALSSEISVGLTPVTSLLNPLASCFNDFWRRHQGARLRALEMRPNQILEQLRNGNLDFALTSQLSPADRSLEWLQICRLPSVIAARKSHPLRGASSIQDLHAADWMALDSLSDSASPFNMLFAQNGLERPARTIECTSMTLAVRLALETDLLVLLSRESFLNPAINGEMCIVGVREALPERIVSLVSRNQDMLTLSARELFDSIRDATRRHYA